MNDSSKHRIMLVEDEQELAAIIRDYLLSENFAVDIYHNGAGIVEDVRENEPELILLDLMLPIVDGITICKQLRQFSDVPIIMITARVEEVDRLKGLGIGADDYICKPIGPREVVARVKAVLRRTRPKLSHLRTQQTGLQLDDDFFTAHVNGSALDLTAAEFHLLKLLANTPGKVFSRQQIIEAIYRDKRVISARSIDTHVKNLRRKIMTHLACDSDPIQAVYGVGYKLGPI